MTTSRSIKGEPLIALGLLLSIWLLARLVLWESPFAEGLALADRPTFDALSSSTGPGLSISSVDETAPTSVTRLAGNGIRAGRGPRPWPSKRFVSGEFVSGAYPAIAPANEVPIAPFVRRESAVIQPHSYLGGATAVEPFDRNPAPASIDRWRLDSWLLARPGPTLATRRQAIRPASYGASQTGAILRLRLKPSSGHRPVLYGRASRALGENAETDIALGFAARPMPAMPVSAYVESRVTFIGGEAMIRPAVFAVTEIAPQQLPLGAQAEIYGQGGFVGGTFATPFVDGHARIDRSLGRVMGVEVSAGGGVWAGAQKGASRVDLGPSARVDVKLADVPIRISADYRLRVAGSAEPPSGPAITISSGF